MLALAVSSFQSYYSEQAAKVDGISATIGPGFWVLLAGAVLAVVGTVFVCLPSRTPSTVDTDDTDTPPMGFPAPAIRE
jgi:hypothetical protein